MWYVVVDIRRNLETTAGFKIPGFTDFPTLDSHIAKFVNGGMSDTCTKACSMLGILILVIYFSFGYLFFD